MPPKLSKSFENFYQAVKAIDDLNKHKKQFVELAVCFLKDHPLPEPAEKKKKMKAATIAKKAKKPLKKDESEDGEIISRKKILIGVVDKPQKKAKSTRSKTSRKI
jgi:hypothetical protein